MNIAPPLPDEDDDSEPYVPGRYDPDERGQYLIQPPFDAHTLRPWSQMDTWDARTAVLMIVIGFPVDVESEFENADATDPWTTDPKVAHARLLTYEDAFSIAQASIRAGKIYEHSTPEQWVAWAISKGYAVDHLAWVGPASAKGTSLVHRTTDRKGESLNDVIARLIDELGGNPSNKGLWARLIEETHLPDGKRPSILLHRALDDKGPIEHYDGEKISMLEFTDIRQRAYKLRTKSPKA